MGFTTVDTKERDKEQRITKENRALMKKGYTAHNDMTLQPIEVEGKTEEEMQTLEADDAKIRAKRLGSSREKARAAAFKRQDKSLEEDIAEKDIDDLTDDELDSMTNKMIFGKKK